MTATRNQMLDGYVTCALWSSVDDQGDPLDANYGKGDISGMALTKMLADCLMFKGQNASDIAESGLSDEQVGHDLWLTRNGHGAGFWDRDLGEVGERLSEAARKMGEQDLYVGDDGKLYL